MHNILLVAVAIPLILVIVIGYLTLFRCRSEKKNYFLLILVSMIFILVGHILELLSNSTDEAFTAIRVLYIGSGLIPPFILLFVADYCDIRIHKFIKAIIMALALVFIAGMWTTNTTGLLYESYWYDSKVTHYLLYNSGKLNMVFRLYPSLFAIIPVGLIISKVRKNHGQYRVSLMILLASILFPYVAETLYVLITIRGNFTTNIYFTPHVLAISTVFLYIGIMKYDMFDATPVAALMAMETISEGFLLLDSSFACLSSNGSAKRLFPSLANLQRGESVYKASDWPMELSPAVFSGNEHQVNYERENAGSKLYYRANINLASQTRLGSKRNLWSVLIQDVTESENFVKQLAKAAYTDTLTGLYNRRHFAEMVIPFIERARRMGTPYYIVISDLDFFKHVNDKYGHLAGDEVLCNTAKILKHTIRAYDILARWGGEEFIILITDPDESNVLNLTERIRKNIEETEVEYEEHKIKITISSGVAQNDGECDLAEIVKRADDALYISKQSGRNKVTLWGK
ncbi:diguanylate cyclase [Lachnospiraceae bacterium ZAX-1]